MALDLSKISVIAEFDRIGVKYQVVGDAELKVNCPAHLDDTPSCTVSTINRKWKCHSALCGQSGDIVTFIALYASQHGIAVTRESVWEDMVRRYGIDDIVGVDSSIIEKWVDNVDSAGPFLKELYDRGMTKGMILKYRLGFDGSRITIPIYNKDGIPINVRRYLPGAPSADKMKSIRSRGSIALFPIDELKYPKIVICGGEIKAIVTAELLHAKGIGAISTTGGEGSWSADFTPKFKGKDIYIMMDIDEGGVSAADKLALILSQVASNVFIVRLPLDKDKYPKGDVNDFIGRENKTAEDLFDVIINSHPFVTPVAPVDQLSIVPAISVSLPQISSSEYANKIVESTATIVAIDLNPYIVPRDIRLSCSRDQKMCVVCPIFAMKADNNNCVNLSINQQSPSILTFIESTKSSQMALIRDALKMPPCKVVSISVTSYWNVEEVRLVPQLNSSDSTQYVTQPAYYVGKGLETNSDYVMTGRVHPDPRTQKAVFLVSSARLAVDALSSFVTTSEDYENFKIFSPLEWSIDALTAKIDEMYDDISHNVTKIYCRKDMHLAVDLAYHSLLSLKVGETKFKGWVESLIVGDSAQGKTEVVTSLQRHYSLGEKIDCKNASVSGLLGGLQQVNNRWFVTWGVIPQNDRRLVILEELKGASTSVISKLTDMRSSGIAEIPKIEKRKTFARTRVIAMSNPRSENTVSSYNYGLDVISELIGATEDIRRFDISLIVSANQIKADSLQLEREHKVPHFMVQDICRRLILWAWTRAEDDVIFDEAALAFLKTAAITMCKNFSDEIPIVDKGSMWMKLCRLSAALAARTASINEDDKRLIVRECHVQYITDMLTRIYSEDSFGYRQFSVNTNRMNSLAYVDELEEFIRGLPFPKSFVETMLNLREIDMNDICDLTGTDRIAAQIHMSRMVKCRALVRHKRAYKKTPAFVAFLKSIYDTLKNSDRVGEFQVPSWITF